VHASGGGKSHGSRGGAKGAAGAIAPPKAVKHTREIYIYIYIYIVKILCVNIYTLNFM
jgi:hypothetical protein